MDSLYRNIGSKIKNMTKLIFGFGVGLSCLIGLVLLAYETVETFIIGLAIAGGGSFLSWVLSLISYGFGELVENSAKFLDNQAMMILSSSVTPDSSTNARYDTSFQNEFAPISQPPKNVHANYETVGNTRYISLTCPKCYKKITFDEESAGNNPVVCPSCSQKINIIR